MNLRKLAKDKPCMIRVPGICNRTPETTVLAHLRMIGLSGAGLKAADWFAAWACSDCHDYVDNRRYRALPEERRLALLEGVIRTQHELVERGYLLSEALRLTTTGEKHGS